MAELSLSLERMSFLQLVQLLGFVAAYMLAIGGLLGPRGRWRATGLSLLLAAGFVAATDPWVHGALLVVFVIGGLGLFVFFTWVMARLLASRLPGTGPVVVEMDQTPPLPSMPAAESASPTESVPAADPELSLAGQRAAPKLARRALR